MSRPLIGLAAALLVFVSACSDDAGTDGLPSLRVNGQLLGASGDLSFPAIKVGDVTSVGLELVNLGDGPLRLIGDPPVRVIEDSALAFSATQPSLRELPPGAATSFVTTFSPRAVGEATAILVIETDSVEAPETALTLSGDGLAGGLPTLSLTVAGVSEPEVWAFGRKEADTETKVAVRLTNDGAGTLTFGPASVSVVGTDADQFGVVGPDKLALGPEESATATLTFAPTRCGEFDARLSIATNASGDPRVLPLTGEAIVSPLALAGVTDTSLIQIPDLTVAASSDGAVIAIANPSAESYDGVLTLAGFEGCGLMEIDRITADDVGYGGALFAAAAALTADGETLLVTARDHTTGWLFDLTTPGAAPLTLATKDAGAGHGRAATLSDDGSLAVVGQPLAAGAGDAHGAAFVWARPAGGWASASESTVKLLPTEVTLTTRLGQSVDATTDGSVVVAGALVRRADQALAPAAFAYVAHDGTWGEERLPTNGYVRNPTVTLVGSGTAATNATVHAAISGDGSTVALAVAQSGGSVDLLLFESSSVGWGTPDIAEGVAHETAHLRLAGSTGWRFALAADGSYLVGGDATGLVQLDRPEAGWTDEVQPARQWDVEAFGDILLLEGGAILGVLTPSGALEILWR